MVALRFFRMCLAAATVLILGQTFAYAQVAGSVSPLPGVGGEQITPIAVPGASVPDFFIQAITGRTTEHYQTANQDGSWSTGLFDDDLWSIPNTYPMFQVDARQEFETSEISTGANWSSLIDTDGVDTDPTQNAKAFARHLRTFWNRILNPSATEPAGSGYTPSLTSVWPETKPFKYAILVGPFDSRERKENGAWHGLLRRDPADGVGDLPVDRNYGHFVSTNGIAKRREYYRTFFSVLKAEMSRLQLSNNQPIPLPTRLFTDSEGVGDINNFWIYSVDAAKKTENSTNPTTPINQYSGQSFDGVYNLKQWINLHQEYRDLPVTDPLPGDTYCFACSHNRYFRTSLIVTDAHTRAQVYALGKAVAEPFHESFRDVKYGDWNIAPSSPEHQQILGWPSDRWSTGGDQGYNDGGFDSLSSPIVNYGSQYVGALPTSFGSAIPTYYGDFPYSVDPNWVPLTQDIFGAYSVARWVNHALFKYGRSSVLLTDQQIANLRVFNSDGSSGAYQTATRLDDQTGLPARTEEGNIITDTFLKTEYVYPLAVIGKYVALENIRSMNSPEVLLRGQDIVPSVSVIAHAFANRSARNPHLDAYGSGLINYLGLYENNMVDFMFTAWKSQPDKVRAFWCFDGTRYRAPQPDNLEDARRLEVLRQSMKRYLRNAFARMQASLQPEEIPAPNPGQEKN